MPKDERTYVKDGVRNYLNRHDSDKKDTAKRYLELSFISKDRILFKERVVLILPESCQTYKNTASYTEICLPMTYYDICDNVPN